MPYESTAYAAMSFEEMLKRGLINPYLRQAWKAIHGIDPLLDFERVKESNRRRFVFALILFGLAGLGFIAMRFTTYGEEGMLLACMVLTLFGILMILNCRKKSEEASRFARASRFFNYFLDDEDVHLYPPEVFENEIRLRGAELQEISKATDTQKGKEAAESLTDLPFFLDQFGIFIEVTPPKR